MQVSASPSLFWCQLAVPKQGHLAQEYEDAACGDPLKGRFAIADGASESSYSGLWANLLTQAFVREPPNLSGDVDFDHWLKPIQARWRHSLPNGEMSWFAEIKRDEEGASATWLGIEFHIHGPTEIRWTAKAVGDACLFLLRQGRLHQSFPIEQSEDFGIQPDLLNTNANTSPRVQTRCDHVQNGDHFLLMTDALAHWCLSQHERGRDPWTELEPFTAPGANDRQVRFVEWISRLREEDGLRNDDVTLILIKPCIPTHTPPGGRP